MLTVTWSSATGWSAPHIHPYAPLTLHPTTSVLHYATTCFEGLKLYRGTSSSSSSSSNDVDIDNNKLRLFRPTLNCARFLRSATRISLPAFDPSALLELIKSLAALDGPFALPKSRPGSFLYIRPTLIGSEAALGVRAPNEATLFVIMTHFADLSTEMMAQGGMRLLGSENAARAWPGGFGNAKVGANYGPTLLATRAAREKGFEQVLWLFGDGDRVTEAGASNFLVVWRTREGGVEIVTEGLESGVILDGVTRRSVLGLVRERLSVEAVSGGGERSRRWGVEGVESVEVVEREFGMGEVVQACKEGRMLEAMVCGTAWFVTGVRAVGYKGEEWDMGGFDGEGKGRGGMYTRLLQGWLKDIMFGREEHDWAVVIDEE